MGNKKEKCSVYVADFETTVYENQEYTEVWASAIVKIGSEDVSIFGSIDELFNFLCEQKNSSIVYFHNLKFDGAFWLDYLIRVLDYNLATYNENGKLNFYEDYNMQNETFKLVVSDMGQWYTITIKTHDKYIYLRDSLKLLPFSVSQIGKAFNTKHQKLDMKYGGYRYANCYISDKEKEYIKNDVLVVKEALEIMFSQGHNKLTIGACCLKEYKHEMFYFYDEYFPKLNVYELEGESIELNGVTDIEQWVRKAYKGGWCYLVKGKENRLFKNGTTADVNSLYPSVMHSESGNYYPIGEPHYKLHKRKFNTGEELLNYLHDKDEVFYFLHIKCRFEIKDGYLPFIQIKNNVNYKSNECLTTSDVWNEKQKSYCRFRVDENGIIKENIVDLYMTMTDYKLFIEHYHIYELELIDTVYFNQEIGIFDDYINKYKQIKMTSKGAMRTLAKLFLNNLYGKFSSSRISSFKVPFLKEDESIGFESEYSEETSKVVYIPVGTAVTSYARNFTIRAAQQNYHGVNKRGFIYADTDSIHCDLKPNEIKGITVDDNNFNCWKLESSWDIAKFVRQKTYIEHITHENLQEIENPYYSVKCAGMPERCKNLFIASMTNNKLDDSENYSKEMREFVTEKRSIDDFKVGLIVPGKLIPKRIKGGVILTETTFEMR